jgi:hypothetical protein
MQKRNSRSAADVIGSLNSISPAFPNEVRDKGDGKHRFVSICLMFYLCICLCHSKALILPPDLSDFLAASVFVLINQKLLAKR